NLPRPMATNRPVDEEEANTPINETYMERRVRRTGVNLGVRIGENYVDYSEGPIKETGNPLDLALTDRGFFAIEYTNKAGVTSTKYTRDGNFTMNRLGYLQTQDGDYLLDEDGRRIQVDPAVEIGINRFGDIYQDGELVATIGITDFEDYNYLERFGENFFQPVEGATVLDRETVEEEFGTTTEIRAGYLEMANISVVTEMVNMIALQRQYESNQKVITTYDDTLEQAVTNGRLNG
ncbi:MAG: flagellar hook-basal body protein, partial [Lachnospiraceae bacterium]|nr:flagellar hook-basal body protein [Lachnospiraceae bacterium]